MPQLFFVRKKNPHDGGHADQKGLKDWKNVKTKIFTNKL